MLYGPRDVRFEERADPKIIKPTDAIIRISATCVCGSDLWPYRGISPVSQPTPMGHEYCGIVEEVGSAVTLDQARPVRHRLVLRLRQHLPPLPGRLPVVLPASRVHRRRAGAAACACRSRTARWWRPRMFPSDDLIPSLLALSDVMGTGWFAADAANVKPGTTVVGRRRRRGRPARRALRQADGRRSGSSR